MPGRPPPKKKPTRVQLGLFGGEEKIRIVKRSPAEQIAERLIKARLVSKTVGRLNKSLNPAMVKGITSQAIDVKKQLLKPIGQLVHYPAVKPEVLVELLARFRKEGLHARVAEKDLIERVMSHPEFLRKHLLARPEHLQEIRSAVAAVFDWARVRRETVLRQEGFVKVSAGRKKIGREQRMQQAHLRDILKEK